MKRDQLHPKVRPDPPVGQPASSSKPKHPDPQSQSLSQSYGSNLPTSLTYIILSTRGYSPRRPAADMGKSWCDSAITLSLIFKVPPSTHGHRKNCCALCLDQNPFSPRRNSVNFQIVCRFVTKFRLISHQIHKGKKVDFAPNLGRFRTKFRRVKR